MEIRDETGGLVLPNSTEAEISVLGAMLQDSNAVLRAAEQISIIRSIKKYLQRWRG